MMALPKPLHDLFRPPPTPGVLAVFSHLDTTLAAIKRLRAAGHADFTVYSPIPRHEIEDALGQPGTPAPRLTRTGGTPGGPTGPGIRPYMRYDGRTVLGGKPTGWIPPTVATRFELTLWFAALAP